MEWSTGENNLSISTGDKGEASSKGIETLHQPSFEFEMHTPLALTRNPDRTRKALRKKHIKIYQFCCFWGDPHAKQF